MCLLTFDGHLHAHFQNYSGTQNSSFYSISIWGKEGTKPVNRNLFLSTMNNNEKVSFFTKKIYKMNRNVRIRYAPVGFILKIKTLEFIPMNQTILCFFMVLFLMGLLEKE
eukprot:TRINITY_DN20911_c1_g1_i2.p1 TRINITY_DN20911_c1_g1~~TRINITY_DN20911_c1_g1_i2.p1  ORF type:complete len:110 (+),score=3.39 TRINITY_DN20911_c1_g1_i2:453-782(+)